MNQEEIDTLNESITRRLKLYIKNLPTKKSLGTDGLMAEFYQNIQRRIKTNPSQTLPKNRSRENIFRLILLGWHYPDTKARQRKIPQEKETISKYF